MKTIHMQLLSGVVTTLLLLVVCSPKQTSAFRTGSATLNTWPVREDFNPTLPMNRAMVIVFDGSGSMNDNNKISQAKTALRAYIDPLQKDVQIGAVVFDGDGLRKLSDIIHERSSLLVELSNVRASHGTPLAEAMAMAHDMLAEWAKNQKGSYECHLVVITDGIADDEGLLISCVDQIIKTPIRIFTIGFQIGTEHPLNKPGTSARYVAADNLDELSKGLAQVLAEKE